MIRSIIVFVVLIMSFRSFGQHYWAIVNTKTGKEKKIKFKRFDSITTHGKTWDSRDVTVNDSILSFRTRVVLDSTEQTLEYVQRIKKRDGTNRRIKSDSLIRMEYYSRTYADTTISLHIDDVLSFDYAASSNRDRAIANVQNGAMFNGMLITGLSIATVATFIFGDNEDGLILLGGTVGTLIYVCYLNSRTRTKTFDMTEEYRFKTPANTVHIP